MKIFKRMTAMAMAMVMIVSMLSIGLTSQASILDSKSNVTINVVVPETIYLKPGTADFQYYIAGAANGNAPATAKTTTGSYSFNCSAQAKSISVSVSGAATAPTLSVPSVTNNTQLTGSISGGVMASATASGLLTWTFTFVVPHTHGGQTSDITYTAKAYTYVYAPFLGQAGIQTNNTYKTTVGNEPKINAFAFIVGIHSTDGGPYRSAFVDTTATKQVTVGTDTVTLYTMSPLIEGWSSGYGANSHVPQSINKDDWKLPNCELYFPEDAHGGISYRETGRYRDGSTTHRHGSTDGYGILTIDKSRYGSATYASIPNFAGGWMVFGNENSSEKHKVSSYTANGGDYSISFVSANNGVDYSSGDRGLSYYPYYSNDTIPQNDTEYTVTINYAMRRWGSSTCDVYATFGLHVNVVDKTTLRQLVNDAISANYQSSDYDADLFTAFSNALKTAATKLGDVTASQTDIDAAAAALTAAENNLKTQGSKSYTATVTHKLPMAESMANTLIDTTNNTYNGTAYSEVSYDEGYVWVKEIKSFPSASDVTVRPETFAGFSTNEAAQSFTKRRSNIDVTYTYTAKTSKIYFDYNDSHVIGLSQLPEDLDVYYGQPYGTLPTPTMDGWNFKGWYEAGTNNKIVGATVCGMINSTLYLQARWECFFSGGYGTQNEPFQIAKVGDLETIGDATAYKINNGSGGTAGKYYKQTADISYASNNAPVLSFGGVYDGDNKTLTVPDDRIVSASTYGNIFGEVNGATIKNINVTVDGEFRYTGSSGYAGFIGTATNSTLNNIHIIYRGTNKGASSGILASTTTDTNVTNCSVDVRSGTVTGDAFIGSRTGGTSYSNNWVLLARTMDSVTSATANGTVHVRENTTAALTYAEGRFTFTATPNQGWGAQFRNASDAVQVNGAVYSPETDETGVVLYACAVQGMTFAAGQHGTLTGADTYQLRQGETVAGLQPVANEGYNFTGWTGAGNPGPNGTMTETSAGVYSYTMGTIGGTMTATFGANTYTVKFRNGTAAMTIPVQMPNDQTYTFEQSARFAGSDAPDPDGWTFQGWYSQPEGAGTRYLLDSPLGALSKVNGDEVLVYAYFTQDEYTVTLWEDLNTRAPVTVTTNGPLRYGDYVTLPSYSKTGYKNLIWNTDYNGTGYDYAPNTEDVLRVTGNVDLYAQWTPITYYITFQAEAGVIVPEPVARTYDDPAWVIPADLKPDGVNYVYAAIRAGYDFAGWYCADTNVVYNIGGSVPAKLRDAWDDNNPNPVVLSARWTPKHYTVTWVLGDVRDPDTNTVLYVGYLNGSTTVEPTDVIFDDYYTLPSGTPTMETKRFIGWFTESGTLVDNTTRVTDTADHSIYAHWADAKYTLVYHANCNFDPYTNEDATFAYEVTYGHPENIVFADNEFTRAGYTFKNWNTVRNPQEEPDLAAEFVPGTSPIDDLTTVNGEEIHLYAQWTGQRFTINYELYGIGSASTNNVTMDGSAINLRKPQNTTEYVFKGWAYNEQDQLDLKKAYDGGVFREFSLTEEELAKCTVDLATNTITFYAIWARKNTVTWNLMGGKLALVDKQNNNAVLNVFSSGPVYAPIKVDGVTTVEQIANADGSLILNDQGMPKTEAITNWFSTVVIRGDAYVPPLTFPTLARNVFRVWSTTTEDSGAINATTILNANEDKTLYAIWNSDGGSDTAVYTIEYYSQNLPGSAQPYALTSTLSPSGVLGTEVDITESVNAAIPDGFELNTTLSVLSGEIGEDQGDDADPLVLKVYYDRKQYSVSFNANGGTGDAMAAADYVYGETRALPANTYTREGYSFLGWATTAGATAPTYFDADERFQMGSANVELFAVWSIGQYTITFILYGSTVYDTVTANYGASVTAPDDPTREGYRFVGWDTTIPSTMPARNLTITATWNVKQFTITYYLFDGGTVYYSQTADYGTAITAPSNPTREGYQFLGWNTTIPSTMPAENVIRYGTWEVKSYTLTFAKGYNGTDYYTRSTVEYGTAITLPTEEPTREGYSFTGWKNATDPDQPIPTTMPAKDQTITAGWLVQQYVLTFAKGYDDEEPNYFSESVDFGSSVQDAAPSNPSREGYTFGGWEIDGAIVTYLPSTMPARNLTITATWDIQQYTLTFLYTEGGLEYTHITADYGTPITTPDNPVREGHTFTGWSPANVPTTMPAQNMTFVALWDVGSHKLIITDGFGYNIVDQDLEYGAAITLPGDPSREGYDFLRWFYVEESTTLIPTSMPNADVTIRATWNTHVYTVRFNGNGGTGSMDDQQFTYDVAQPLTLNAFEKAGSTFVGWSGAPGFDRNLTDGETVKNLTAENNKTIVLTAEWSDVAYTISFDLGDGVADPNQADGMVVNGYTTVRGDEITMPSGAGLTWDTETDYRTFIKWTRNGLEYNPGDVFTMPAEDVTFTALWSANYRPLDNEIALIEGYYTANSLPANATHDPRYAAGGDFAQLLESGGNYPVNNFNSEELESMLAAAKTFARGLPSHEQVMVDAMTTDLHAALDTIYLLDVDYDVTYKCAHSKKGYYDSSTRKYYPPCESGTKHSFNSVLALIDTLLNTADADNLYQADSLASLRVEVYGNSNKAGIVKEARDAALKKPAQASLEAYVDRLALAYHSIPQLKDADYSVIDSLITDYLPQTKQVVYENLMNYYTAETVQALQQYYSSIVRTYKITRQSVINGRIYNELKGYIDALQTRPADYSAVYAWILRIPKGDSFNYPSGSVTDTAVWVEWTTANAGRISQAVDAEFLNTRYEASTVTVLNNVLDDIDWSLSIFDQSQVNGSGNLTYEKRLETAVKALVRRTYSITFMMNDGTDTVYTRSLGFYYGDIVQLPMSNPSRATHLFLNWSSSPTQNIPVTTNDTVSGNMIYYAFWEQNVASISFDLNGGEGTLPEPIEADVGVAITLPNGNDLNKEGFTFLGWSADPQATSGSFTYTLTEKVDVTLYAIWGGLSVQLIGKEGTKTVIDNENHFIYGLDFGLNRYSLPEYLDVVGNGTLQILSSNYVGTGTQVQLINNYTGEVEATYTLVIFGDLDGDGQVGSQDIQKAKGNLSGAESFEYGSAQLLAADVDGDGIVGVQDLGRIKGMISGAVTIDQATRRTV